MTRVLVVNTGSSTLKLAVVGTDDHVEASQLDYWDGNDVRAFIEAAETIDAVGHRVVHGGRHFSSATVVTSAVEEKIVALTPLAPLHQPREITALRAAREVLPAVPHVACFDTAFHSTMPDAARTYALPAGWRERWAVQRYGFHGLSHAWTAKRAPVIAERDGDVRVVSCHLGAGASLCAIEGGQSVDTTMGFTPLEGLVMATRSGSVDPGLILWLLEDAGLDVATVRDGLEHRSGLAGLSATSGDMREVLAARARGDTAAELAFTVYVHRLTREIAAMSAALGGLDVLAFTGGVGEYAPPVRAAAAERLAYLGVAIDSVRNDACTGDGELTVAGAPVATVVVTAREELEIADQVRGVVD